VHEKQTKSNNSKAIARLLNPKWNSIKSLRIDVQKKAKEKKCWLVREQQF
jgi:hypothetical protein